MQHLFAFFMQEQATEAIPVEDTLQAVHVSKQRKENLQKLKASLDQELEKIQSLFIHFLQLLVDWTCIDKEKAHALLTPPCSTLAQNYLLQALPHHAIFSVRQPLNTWPEDLAETWYYQCVKNHPSFLAYISQSSHTHDQDRDIVFDLIKKIMLKHENIQKYASWEDICWAENKLIVQRLLLNFVAELAEAPSGQKPPYSLAISLQEKEFYTRLISKTVENKAMYEVYMAKRSKNWDLARITFLDRLLIKMALTEVVDGIDIPKRVAINEYLDLAKKYSTPKSHLFINGMLEALIAELISSRA